MAVRLIGVVGTVLFAVAAVGNMRAIATAPDTDPWAFMYYIGATLAVCVTYGCARLTIAGDKPCRS